MNALFENNIDKQELRWIRKAKKGNHKAFERLVVKYQKQIYFAVRKIVLDHDDATDIVQESFVKAYKNMGRFDEQYPFYPWLFRIAVNTSLNYQQKISRQRETFVKQNDEEINQLSASNGNPLEQALQTELEEKIANAIAALPFDQRLVFILKTSEDLSYQEISEQLEISPGTVMSRLSRARGKLIELLQPYLTSIDGEVKK